MEISICGLSLGPLEVNLLRTGGPLFTAVWMSVDFCICWMRESKCLCVRGDDRQCFLVFHPHRWTEGGLIILRQINESFINRMSRGASPEAVKLAMNGPKSNETRINNFVNWPAISELMDKLLNGCMTDAQTEIKASTCQRLEDTAARGRVQHQLLLSSWINCCLMKASGQDNMPQIQPHRHKY